MCGICGIAAARGTIDPERLARMSTTLLHRGPDSEGAHVGDGIGLAARRLAIIDLTGGDQPIANEDGSVVVVQNGEIYNHLELRAELERAGHRFTTRCDTEVLAHGYEQWGARLWERLRGMFAVAVHDARSRSLVLARDPFGIKPLYYRDADGELAFASELDALPRGEIDLDALEAFLTFNVIPAPLSIYREIRKLPAGHTLTWSKGKVALERYARPGPLQPRAGVDEAELVEECRARLRDSVRAHLIADVPVGVLLSGGVDSGALAALAAEESSEAVRTFSIGFEESSFDELDGARAVSLRYGTQHRELVLRPDAALLLPALADAFDEPFADSSALPTYLVSKLAAEDVKVALSGEGGDELFGGYYTYVADRLAEHIGPAASLARPAIELLPSSTRKASFDYKAKRFARSAHLPPLERHHGWKEVFAPDARAELTGSRRAFDPVDTLRERFAETEGHDLLARLQDVDFGVYLVDDLLVKTDRASMAWSLEARVPFMDPVVANFAFSLPARHKVRGLQKKRLLRKAVAQLLPGEVVHGRKRGFSIPAAAWLRGDLLPFARETLEPGERAQAGVPAARGRQPAPGRPRRGPRGPFAAALGPHGLHPVARAARRRCPPRCAARAGLRVKVWVDFTASAHPLVFRPLVNLLEQQGHEVEITARDYAQTLQLIAAHGMTATVIGHHGGRSSLGKARQMRTRLKALRAWARPREFDLALAHGSHELTMTAHRLGIPSATTFDYEWAWLQHQLGCRAATRVVVPDAIPPERLARYHATPPKLQQYPGLKEEYYLSDFEPDPSVPSAFGIEAERVLVVLRPPPDVSLYHRHSNPLFPQTLEHLGRRDDVHAFVIPRTDEQRDFVRNLDLPSVLVPEEAVDAQSLIALADLVVSAGGTMNREAAALGVPVYTTYGGRLGGVDEELIRAGRLRPLTDPRALELHKREHLPESRVRRDPQLMLDLLLSALS